MTLTGTTIGVFAGLLAGVANYFLLRLAGRRAGRAPGRMPAVAWVLGGYTLRYILIIGLTLLLSRVFNLQLALVFLLGMMLATVGMAILARRGTAQKAETPAAEDTRRNPPDR